MPPAHSIISTFRGSSVVVNLGSLRIALVMIVVFFISFGIMWRQRQTQDVDMPMPRSTPVAAEHTGAPLPVATAAPVIDPRDAVPPPIAVQRVQPAASLGSVNDAASRQIMPVSIHIWNRERKHKIEGAVQSLSTTTIFITARVESDATHDTSEFQLVVDPGQTQIFSTDNGLQIHSRDQITFHSSPYEDQTHIVP